MRREQLAAIWWILGVAVVVVSPAMLLVLAYFVGRWTA